MNISFYVEKETIDRTNKEWLGAAVLQEPLDEIRKSCEKARRFPEENGSEEMMFRTMVHRYLSDNPSSLIATQINKRIIAPLELRLVLKVD